MSRKRPEVPESLSRRPWDERRNVPVPVFNEVVRDGEVTHDFTLVNWDLSADCADKRACGVCGTALGYYAAFLGGPLSGQSRCYVDPPMHEECAEASMRLCPHISIPHAGRAADSRMSPEAVTSPGMSLDKPREWVMGIARSWKVVHSSVHGPHIKAAPWVRTRRFVYEGMRLVEQNPTP